MFDDPQKELRRLEQQLLAEEEDGDWLDDELAEARQLLGDDPYDDAEQAVQPQIRNYANGYGAGVRGRNTDCADVDLEEYSDQVYEEPREKGITGLVILACLETLGIVAVIIYWLLVLL